jgi:hypothetical protein
MAQISLSADLLSHAIDLSAAFGWSRWLQRWQRLVTWLSPTGRQMVPVGVRRLISLHRKTLRPDSLLHSVGGCFCRSAFCPIFRSHGRRSGSLPQDDSGRCGRTGASNEIWNFGTEAEAAIAKVMRIREQLRPYIMEQYRAASETGRPVMTPMFFDFWEDSVAATVDDQMMFGPGAFRLHEPRPLFIFSFLSAPLADTNDLCASIDCIVRLPRGASAGRECDGTLCLPTQATIAIFMAKLLHRRDSQHHGKQRQYQRANPARYVSAVPQAQSSVLPACVAATPTATATVTTEGRHLWGHV